MVRKNLPNFLYKEDLVNRLIADGQSKEYITKLGKNDLVWLASEKSLISNIERDDSFNKRTSTLPCYLYTHVVDKDVREKIEEYVQSYSMLYSRGSYLANLVALSTMNTTSKELPLETIPIPPFLLNENIMKTCFLPERWLLRKNPQSLQSDIQTTYTAHKETLAAFLPPYTKVLSNCGWDNAINHMGTFYLGNVKTMVLPNLEKRLKAYLYDIRTLQSRTDRKEVVKCCCYELRPSSMIHNDDFEWISKFRKFAGLKDNECFYSVVEELSDLTWTLHIWLQGLLKDTESKSFSILPVSPIGRKYAYIDNKIITSLLDSKTRKRMLETTQNHKGSELQKVLGLTSTLFNKRRMTIRKKLMKKYKEPNDPKHKKLKQKWKKVGHGCLPPTATVKTVSTDGVGLRICLEFIPKDNPSKNCTNKKPFDNKSTDAIGWDTGRVRIITSADENGKVVIVSRKGYYNAQRTKQFREYETSRKKGTAWGQVLADVSKAGGFKNNDIVKWAASLEVIGKNINIIKNEQLLQKDLALWKMRRFRWKKAFFDQKIKQIIMPSIKKNRNVNIGIGDGSFSHTGRGEMSVPTKSIQTKVERVLKMLKIKDKVKTTEINEYNTTQCCYKCDAKMNILLTKTGNDCLRYRLCTCCSTKTYGKRRNRDVNAAKNMLRLLRLEMDGCPRPLHLTRAG